MLSHDTKLRCDLVDLYFTLYGSKRPVCLPIPIPELANIMKPQRQHAGPPPIHEPKRIRTLAPIRGPPVTVIDSIKRSSPITVKNEINDVIILDNNVGVIDMAVVVEDPKTKVKVCLF